ncbi:acyltransferase domain-containing protein, partial [Streptosporangium vulgare]
RTENAQIALFAVEVALFRLLESWGMRPDFLLGHSIGELVAAHVAGAMSLQDATHLVAARGRLMQALPAGGAMVALQATETEVAPLLPATISIAAVNGPQAIVISGDETAVTEISAHFTTQGRKTRRLRVSHAFHSPLMEPMLADFHRIAETITYHPPAIPVISNLTGEPVTGFTADYWVRHVREAVRFTDGLTYLHSHGVKTFIELGPDGVLSAMGHDSAEEGLFVPVLRKDRSETENLVTALARAFVAGAKVDWKAYQAGSGGKLVDLPTYPFEHRHYWLSSKSAPSAGHPLLDVTTPLAEGDGMVMTGRLSAGAQPWFADHLVAGLTVVPATALAELSLHAGEQVGCDTLDELVVEVPLLLPEARTRLLQVSVGAPDGTGRRPLGVFSREEGASEDLPWTRHARGTLAVGGAEETADLTAWPPPGAAEVDVDGLYDDMAAAGLDYGPAFRGLRAAWRDGDRLYAEVALPEELDVAGFGIHPALLDAALHAAGLGLLPGTEQGRLPFAFDRVRLHRTGARSSRVLMTPEGADAVSLVLAGDTGEPVATIGRLALRPFAPERLRETPDSLFRVGWVPVVGGEVVVPGAVVRVGVGRGEG